MTGPPIIDYSWAFDTHNRDRTCDSRNPTNPTNDVTLPLYTAPARMPVNSLYLASLELPYTQYSIEATWNKLFLNEGFIPIVTNSTDVPLTQFTISHDGIVFQAEIPMLLNSIVDVDTSSPTNPIFTTQFNHALLIRNSWTWQPIQLISTNLTNSFYTNLTGNNANLTILSPTTFQLHNIPAGTTFTNSNGIYGYVWAPSIPNPLLLAEVVTNALNVEGPGRFAVTFNDQTGHFSLRTYFRSDSISSSTFLLIPGSNSLPFVMGFGSQDIPIPDKYPAGLDAPSVFLQLGFLTLSPGNYDANTFGAEIQLESNRFYFDRPASSATNSFPGFVFSNAIGMSIAVNIPFGMYTPDTMAEYLQEQMNTLNGLGHLYTVTYDVTSKSFTFSSNDSSIFGLEFADPRSVLAGRLGFNMIPYRGLATYSSPIPVIVPVISVPGTTLPARFLSNVYISVIDSKRRLYTLNVSLPPSLTMQITGNSVDGTVTLSNSTLAHGYQPEDVINVTLLPSGSVYALRVVEVMDAFTLKANIGGVSALNALVDAPVSTSTASTTIDSNLFFNVIPNEPQLHPEIPGFQPRVYQALLDGPPFMGSAIINLEPPSYVLVQLLSPDGSATNQHAWVSETTPISVNNIPTLLAKFLLSPAYRFDRLQSTKYVLQGKILTYVRIRILNPDHSLYQLHGRNWSGCLTFMVPMAGAIPLCP